MKYQGQILASDQPNKIFEEEEEIFIKIKNSYPSSCDYLQAIGIQAPQGTEILLNDKLFEIGQQKILQLNNVQITSIKFNKDIGPFVKIDFVIHDTN